MSILRVLDHTLSYFLMLKKIEKTNKKGYNSKVIAITNTF